MSERIVAALHAVLSDGREVTQGQTVKLSAEDEQKFDEQRALVPKSFASFDEFADAKMDAYRAGRGDTLAAGRLAEARSGGIVDLSTPGAGSDVNSYAEWLRNESPSAAETVAAADDDPDKARSILEAENLVTGGEPRKGVEAKLTAIAEG